MAEFLFIVTISTGAVLLLSVFVLLARARLLPSGDAQVDINDRRQLTVARGERLLAALAEQGVLLPSACGGRGSCGQCRVTVAGGGGEILPTERSLISRADAALGVRLACMVTVNDDMAIRLPDEILEIRKFACSVASSRNVTTFLREILLDVTDGDMVFSAGDYVLVEAPPGESRFADFDIDDSWRAEWARSGLLELAVGRPGAVTRAYSLAAEPDASGRLSLLVRIALPPPRARRGTPPGQVSSWLFGLRAGDRVMVSGPFGDFHADDGGGEIALIGGGAGMAPLRAIIRDQLLNSGSTRRITFWYGARNAAELCYQQEFEELASKFDNFDWHPALSGPDIEPGWEGYRGFVHAVVREHYLQKHAAPEDVHYYLCGPPLMSSAVVALLEDYGVESTHIHFDDFGT